MSPLKEKKNNKSTYRKIIVNSRTRSTPGPLPRVESGLTLRKSPLADTVQFTISTGTTGRLPIWSGYEWTCLPGDSMERGVGQTNEQDNPKACSLASLHPNLRDKDIAEINAPRQEDFHLSTPPPPRLRMLLPCTEIKSQVS